MNKILQIINKKSILSLGLCFGLGMVSAQDFEVDTISQHTDPEHGVNFLYLGDGYALTDQNQFIDDINYINDAFFDFVPFSNYKNFFNVYALKVISPETGIKHPRTAPDCPAANQHPQSNPNNYFNSTFDLNNIHRLIYPSNQYLVQQTAIDHFPMLDQILMIGNTVQYGGAGGAFAVGTIHALSVDIMLHEVGHSFAGLADEYWAGDYYAAEKPNMTHQSNANANTVKWKNWLGFNNVGMYKHGNSGLAAEWYKPHKNCMMEQLNQEFCPVCRQRIIEKIYELVNPIIAYSPTQTNIDINDPLIFELMEMILPIPNTLKMEWFLNGDPIATNVNQVTLEESALTGHNNVLEAIVTDTTALLRVAPSFTHHINKVVWNIKNEDGVGIEIDSENLKNHVKIYPNPARDFMNIEIGGLIHSDKVALEVRDILGRLIWSKDLKVYHGEAEEQLDLSSFVEGNYLLNIRSNDRTEQLKFSVFK